MQRGDRLCALVRFVCGRRDRDSETRRQLLTNEPQHWQESDYPARLTWEGRAQQGRRIGLGSRRLRHGHRSDSAAVITLAHRPEAVRSNPRGGAGCWRRRNPNKRAQTGVRHSPVPGRAVAGLFAASDPPGR